MQLSLDDKVLCHCHTIAILDASCVTHQGLVTLLEYTFVGFACIVAVAVWFLYKREK
jgi:uncharacterized membrane protein